ncbi:MAG: 2-amino-4-hydroxy-6-hydroxymethyldihydropteridine diphosphokinase [Rhodanobacter sp.]|nr:MAG: 2-amino-4-hydroxy-6-hydroxymethyldihydropteridine diphosphokinase [Rhodanobacter sp.]TAM14601.1 MAG: 2-amino-4-hydroxy-6-hydroxymethyldihydropteridine diphosphokinase [Rhodanobacter sp.]TAM37393.1 MAG: 2-amino-4-hydroxy-6-hydroxymethyldihydropteridine diphosphokinase [Rhodanobacter sp.]
MTTAYVALGSNLGDPRQQVLAAFEALAQLPQSRVTARSRLYRTPPWGVVDQPWFVNAAARLDTTLAPEALLDGLQAIERRAGRVRDVRYGPRTLDLDLLHVEGVCRADVRLTLPHPRIAERAFVLLPLAELAPELDVPGQGRVAELLAAADAEGCCLLAE